MKQSVNVLLIDDEQVFLDVLVKRLKKRGFNTWTAGSAEEGLARLDRDPVDLVVLDLCMPGLDGLETLQIRERHLHLGGALRSGGVFTGRHRETF